MPETASPAGASATQDAEISAALGTRSVVLRGMMGAGKSPIGRRLSARVRLPFLDADTEIEAAAGMSISDIFDTHGEPYFRDGEARVIARLLEGGPALLRIAAGALPADETPQPNGDKDPSIWLKADADIILKRGKAPVFPLRIQTAMPATPVGRLISEREPV